MERKEKEIYCKHEVKEVRKRRRGEEKLGKEERKGEEWRGEAKQGEEE